MSKENKVQKRRTKGQMIWYQFRKNKAAVFGMCFLILLILVTIWAQFHYDYDKDVSMTTRDVLAWPSAEHPLGTDHLGRDMLARLLYGGRWSLSIGLGVVCLNTIAGILYGAIATYIGGTVETLMMRFIEAIMMIPGMLMVIVLVGVFGVSTVNLVLAMSIGGIPYQARLTRSVMMPLRNADYVEAARAIGVPSWKIILKHILPNCSSSLIVSFTMRCGGSIMSVGTYSFLGLGVPKPMPEWGTMLSDVRGFMKQRPDLVFYPGMLILLVTLSCNLMGDGLRDALDPKLRSK